jgi:hypothetical protein
VRGRRKTIRVLDAQGHAYRRERRVPRAEWEIFLPEHHEPYIGPERWEQNMAKIAANAARSDVMPRAPGNGASLLAGLLRCRRCGHRLQVRFAKGVRYGCRNGATQRGVTPVTCLTSFAGGVLEQQVEALLLEVLRPGGPSGCRRLLTLRIPRVLPWAILPKPLRGD